MVGSYLDQLEASVPSKKLALAALRRFFDVMVLRHVVALNPAASVRGERYQVIEGKTPEISIAQARTLLAAIDISSTIGLRDRALLATLIYTAARAGAVARLRKKDFISNGSHYTLRFAEKGGKDREIPVRHDLEQYLLDYLKATPGSTDQSAAPLFLSMLGRTGKFTSKPITGLDIWRMVKRRLREAGLPSIFRPHSFRVTTLTNLLDQGVPEGDVQYLAGHADPRTTKLYDRRQKRVTRNVVERISI
jgi:site-specific recombinase XerD